MPEALESVMCDVIKTGNCTWVRARAALCLFLFPPDPPLFSLSLLLLSLLILLHYIIILLCGGFSQRACWSVINPTFLIKKNNWKIKRETIFSLYLTPRWLPNFFWLWIKFFVRRRVTSRGRSFLAPAQVGWIENWGVVTYLWGFKSYLADNGWGCDSGCRALITTLLEL